MGADGAVSAGSPSLAVTEVETFAHLEEDVVRLCRYAHATRGGFLLADADGAHTMRPAGGCRRWVGFFWEGGGGSNVVIPHTESVVEGAILATLEVRGSSADSGNVADRVVLVTPVAYYVVHYAFGSDAVDLFERVLLADVGRAEVTTVVRPATAEPLVAGPRAALALPLPQPLSARGAGGASVGATPDGSDVDGASDSADVLEAALLGSDDDVDDDDGHASDAGSDEDGDGLTPATALPSIDGVDALDSRDTVTPMSATLSAVLIEPSSPAGLDGASAPAQLTRRRSVSLNVAVASVPTSLPRGPTASALVAGLQIAVHFRRAERRNQRGAPLPVAAGHHVFVVAPPRAAVTGASRSPLDDRTTAEQEARLRRFATALQRGVPPVDVAGL